MLCDLVESGYTFAGLYALLRAWCDDAAEPWSVIRRKLRFIGVVARGPTSLKTWRWQQHAPWVRELPGSAIVNVSADRALQDYLWGRQPKLTASFVRERWFDAEAARTPARDAEVRTALEEARLITQYAQSAEGRERLIRSLVREAAFKEPWLRALVVELRRVGRGAASA